MSDRFRHTDYTTAQSLSRDKLIEGLEYYRELYIGLIAYSYGQRVYIDKILDKHPQRKLLESWWALNEDKLSLSSFRLDISSLIRLDKLTIPAMHVNSLDKENKDKDDI